MSPCTVRVFGGVDVNIPIFSVEPDIKNKWSFCASFSQHIPYKIDVIETIVSAEEEKKEDIYGGGEFNLSIIRYLDQ